MYNEDETGATREEAAPATTEKDVTGGDERGQTRWKTRVHLGDIAMMMVSISLADNAIMSISFCSFCS